MTSASTIHLVGNAAAAEGPATGSGLANLVKLARAALTSAPEVAAAAVELVVFSCPTFTELGADPTLRRGLLDNDWNVKFVREVLWNLGLTTAQPFGCFSSDPANPGVALDVASSFMRGEGLRNVLVLVAGSASPPRTALPFLAPAVAGAGAILLSSTVHRGPELVDVRCGAVPEAPASSPQPGKGLLDTAVKLVTELGFDTATDADRPSLVFTNNLAESAQRALLDRLGCSSRCLSRSPRWPNVSFPGDAFDNACFGLAHAPAESSSRSVLLVVGRTSVTAALLRTNASGKELT